MQDFQVTAKKKQKLILSKHLIILERGKEELLLVDSLSLQPLFIKMGRDYVKAFIQQAGRIRESDMIQREFPNDSELLNTLIRHRILVAEDEMPVRESPDASRISEKTSGISLYLLLSQSCNLGCIYCLNGKKTYKTGSNLKMGTAVAFRSVERCLDRLEKGGSLEVVFFGGEPLLNWPMVQKVIRHCEDKLKPLHGDKRLKYHITSNLTVLPDDLVDWAGKYQISILCDVDGKQEIQDRCRPYKDGRGSHATVTANIGKLVQAGLDISLRATITSLNQHKIMEIANHHKALGVRGCGIVPLNPVNSDEDLLDERLIPDASILIKGLEEVYRSGIWSRENLFPFSVYASKVKPGNRITMGCGAPYGNTPVVDTEGRVYPCIYLMGIDRFCLGHVLAENWIDRTRLDRIQRLLYVDNIEECRDCQWRYICGGGCPITRLTVLNQPGCTEKVRHYCARISCDYTKKILELLYWELAEEAASSCNSAT